MGRCGERALAAQICPFKKGPGRSGPGSYPGFFGSVRGESFGSRKFGGQDSLLCACLLRESQFRSVRA